MTAKSKTSAKSGKKAGSGISLARNKKLLDQSVRILLKGRYFQTISEDTLRQVLTQGTYLEVPKNTPLIKEDGLDDDLYFLLKGALKVTSNEKLILRLDTPGDVAGELAVVSSAPRSADVVTDAPSRLIRVSSSAVHDPKLATQFLMAFGHIMAAKLVETSNRAKLYEDSVLQVQQIASSHSKLEVEIGDKLKEITLYSKVIETSNDAVVITDTDGVIERFNPAARRMFPELKAAGRKKTRTKFLTLVKGFDLGDYADSAALSPWRGEWSREQQEDQTVLQSTVSPIADHEGRVTGIAFQLRDISLQKEQERAIATKNEQIQKALVDLESTFQELQRSDKLKTDTLNVVSGELAAPIRKIFTHTENLTLQAPESADPELIHNLESIREQSAYIKVISDNINQLIEIQQNFQTATVEMIDLNSILPDIVEELETLAARKYIKINLESPKESMSLMGDPNQVRLVLNLLLEQSLMAASSHSTIVLKAEVLADSEQIRLRINYDGPSFANIKPGRGSAKGRFGLMIGLPLARKVISQIQGLLQFQGDSKKGQVEIHLPRSQKEGVERPNRIFIADEQDMDHLIIQGVIEYLWPDSVLYITSDPFDLLENYEDFKPDLVIIDPDIAASGWANHRIIASLVQSRQHVCPILSLSSLYKDYAERTIAVERGVTDFLSKPYSIFDLRFKVKSLLQSHRKEETLHQTMDIAQRQAHTDGLTRLANRKHFDTFLETQLNYSRQTKKPCSLIMLDIDNFKHYNDTHGHQLGDEVLKVVAQRLTESVRASDLAARYGGEEFTLVLPETEKDMAAIVAEKARRALQESKVPKADQQPLGFLSASFGVSTFPADGTTVEELIKAADDCLYIAKDHGRNIVIKAGKNMDKPRESPKSTTAGKAPKAAKAN